MARVNPLAQIQRNLYNAPPPQRGGVTFLPPPTMRRPPPRAPARRMAAGGGSIADRAYANQEAFQQFAMEGAQPQAAGGGGQQGLGWVVGKAAEGVMLPLKVLDYGRAAVGATAAELIDVALPALNEPLGKLPFVEAQPYDEEAIDASFDFGDIWQNTKDRKYFKELVIEPIMGEKGTDRPGWVKSTAGFAGDVATDPLTFGAAFGTLAQAGKPARWTYLNKLLDAQKAAEAAGDVARVQRLGGMQAIERMAKRGVGLANPEQAAAMGMNPNALRMFNFAIPGTERMGRALSNVTGLGKEAISGAPGMSLLRGLRQPVGQAGQSLAPNVERLITGRGAMSAESALRGLAADDPMRLAGGAWFGIANVGLSKLARRTRRLGAERVNDMVTRSELGAERNIFTEYADMVREASIEVGGELPNMRPIVRIDPITGARTESQYTIPHVLSRDFRDWLKAAYEGKDPRAVDFMQRSGLRTEDLLEEGGFTQKRWFRPNEDGTPQRFDIGGNELEVAEGTVDELNRKFAAMFPDFEGKVYETDPIEAWRHYIGATRKDVAIRAFGEEAIAREFPGLHRDPGRPAPYDPLGGREQMAPIPSGAPPKFEPPGKIETIDGKPVWVPNPAAKGAPMGRLDVPMRPVERVVRNPQPKPEHEFYRYVPDVNKKGQPGKLTVARNRALSRGEQPRILKEYKETSLAGRQRIARQIDAAREKLIEPIKERKGELLEARIEAKGAMGEASRTAQALEKMRNTIDERIRDANKTIRVAKDRIKKLPAEAEQAIVERQEAILREALQARDELLAQRNQLDFQFRESQKHVQRLAAEPEAQLPFGHPLETGALRESLSTRIEYIDSQIAATLETLKHTKNREQRKILNELLEDYRRVRKEAMRELDEIDATVGFDAARAEGSRADAAQRALIDDLDRMDRRDVFTHTANLRASEKEVAAKLRSVRERMEKNAARKMTKVRTALGDDWYANASEAQRKQAERALRRINPEQWAKYAREYDSMRTLRKESFELERAQTELRQKAAAMQRDLDDPDFEELSIAERNKVQEHINSMIERSNEMGQELHRMQGKIVRISQSIRQSPVAKHADTLAAYEQMIKGIDESGEVKALEIQQRAISRRRKEWALAIADAGWEEQPGGGFIKWAGRRPTRKPAPLRIEEAAPPPPKELPGQLEMRLDEPPPRPAGEPPITAPQAAVPTAPTVDSGVPLNAPAPGDYTRAENAWGGGQAALDEMFPDGIKAGDSLFPKASEREGSGVVGAWIKEATADDLVPIDPRSLHTIQQQVTREHMERYLADAASMPHGQPGSVDELVVIYENAEGRRTLMSGNHRANAAVLRGENVDAILMRYGEGVVRPNKVPTPGVKLLPPKWKRVASGEYERGDWKIVRSEPGVKNSGWDLIDPNGEQVDHWVKLKDVQAAMQRDLPGVGVPYKPPVWSPPREYPGPPKPRPDKIAGEAPWPRRPIERPIPPEPPRPEFGPKGEQQVLPGMKPTEQAQAILDSPIAKQIADRRQRLVDLQPQRIQNEVDKAAEGIGVIGRHVGKRPTDPGELVTWNKKVAERVEKMNAERARIEKWLENHADDIAKIEAAKRVPAEALPTPPPPRVGIEHPKLTEMAERRAQALKGFGSIPERSLRVLAEQMPDIAQTEQKLAAAASRVGAVPAESKEALMAGARDVFEETAALGKTIKEEGLKIEGLQASRQEVDQAVNSTRIDYQSALNDFEAARKEAETIANKVEGMLSPAYAETMVRENKQAAKATKAALERVTKGEATSYEAQPMHRVIEDLRKVVKANPLGDDALMLRIEAQLHSYEQALVDLTEGTDIPAHQLEKILNEISSGKAAPVFQAQLKQTYEMLYEGGDVIINKEIKQSYLQVMEGVTDKGFPRLLRLFTNFFKTYATLSPGFHIRNAMTAIFMNLTEGVPIRQQLRAFHQWGLFAKAENPVAYLRALKATGKKADQATYDAIMATLSSGAGGQFFESGVGELAKGTTRIKEGIFANRVTRLSQRKGQQWVEGPARFALAYDTTIKGGKQIDALHRVTRIHFDYSQVSNFDERMKRFIPFWTFTSRNLPLQFTQMWMKPKIYNRYQSFAHNFAVTPPEFMPEYMTESGAFDTGLRTPDWLPGAAGGMPVIANPDLPQMRLQADIKRMLGPLTGENPSQVLSDFNPAFTAPLEYVTGQDFFTRQRFDADDFSPAGPATVPLAMMLAPFGAARQGADGNWYIQDKAMNSLRSLIPPLDRTSRLMPQATGGKGSDRLLESWLRFGLGAPGRTLSESQQQSEAARRAYEERDKLKMIYATGG